jgi:hypothetical protein
VRQGASVPAIDVKMVLRFTARAIGLAIPVDARAFVINTSLQGGPDGSVQARAFRLGEFGSPPQRVNPGPVQRFIGVNVAHAGNERLVQQQRFDRLLAAL